MDANTAKKEARKRHEKLATEGCGFKTVELKDASGAVIDIESSYVSDSDGEIKPGATETKEIWGPSSGYDHVEIYFTGYGKTE